MPTTYFITQVLNPPNPLPSTCKKTFFLETSIASFSYVIEYVIIHHILRNLPAEAKSCGQATSLYIEQSMHRYFTGMLLMFENRYVNVVGG